MLPTIPGPVRRLVLDGLGRLIHHLLELTEDVRRGLIDAVCRTVSESVEGVLNTVIRSRSLHGTPFNQSHDDGLRQVRVLPESDDPFGDPESCVSTDPVERVGVVDEYDSNRQQYKSLENRDIPSPLTTGRTSWRLVVATGLSGLATWFSKAGLRPCATATAVLAGAILLFPG